MGFLDFFLPGVDAAGQATSAAMTYKIARENRDWQERMANTAHQRAAKDLSAAGLNRVLALGQPAVTPAGNAPTIAAPDLSRASSRAADVKYKGKQGEALDAQIERELASARQADTQAKVNVAQVGLINDQRTKAAMDVHRGGIEAATAGRRGDYYGAQIAHENLRMEGTSYDLERKRIMGDLWREYGSALGPAQAAKHIPALIAGGAAAGALGKGAWALFRRLSPAMKKRLAALWRRHPNRAADVGPRSVYDDIPAGRYRGRGGKGKPRININEEEIPF